MLSHTVVEAMAWLCDALTATMQCYLINNVAYTISAMGVCFLEHPNLLFFFSNLKHIFANLYGAESSTFPVYLAAPLLTFGRDAVEVRCGMHFVTSALVFFFPFTFYKKLSQAFMAKATGYPAIFALAVRFSNLSSILCVQDLVLSTAWTPLDAVRRQKAHFCSWSAHGTCMPGRKIKFQVQRLNWCSSLLLNSRVNVIFL